ncbi:hypothetical protein HYFRA_00006656 [Hymenoscyphus fraxineus]|uniref:BTB domain-containing protein n=1 Tax=Hymenoscyphus fraxineus TaxID=746836 RepID=A0A9N9PS38_9HELO|nr:hypothetical protein HYFRA_00006656 [Hymenoscyphus fraxineus]
MKREILGSDGPVSRKASKLMTPQPGQRGNVDDAIAASSLNLLPKASSLHGLHTFESPEEMVTLIVGKGWDLERFFVHKKKICEHSQFFSSACKPQWMKPEDQCIELPQEDPEIIRAMVYWVYEQKICVHRKSIEHGLTSNTVDNDNIMNTAWGLFLKLYLIAEKFQISELKDDALEAFVDHWCDGHMDEEVPWRSRLETLKISMCVATYVYNNTAEAASPLRRMLIQLIIAGPLEYGRCFDYIAFLKSRVNESVFAAICYDLAKFQQDHLRMSERDDDLIRCEVAMDAPDTWDFKNFLRDSPLSGMVVGRVKGLLIYD